MCRIFEEFQQPAIQTKIVQHFGGFFYQIKVRQPIGRKDSPALAWADAKVVEENWNKKSQDLASLSGSVWASSCKAADGIRSNSA